MPPAPPTGSARTPAALPPLLPTSHQAAMTSAPAAAALDAHAAELSDGALEASCRCATTSSSSKALRTAFLCSADDASCGGAPAPLEAPAAVRRAVSPLPDGAQHIFAPPSALLRECHAESEALLVALEAALAPSAPPPLFGPPAADWLGDKDAVVAKAFADLGRQLCRDVALRAGGAGALELPAAQRASHAAANEQACARRAASPPTVDAGAALMSLPLHMSQRPVAQPRAPAYYRGVNVVQQKSSCRFSAALHGKYITTCDTAEAAARAYDDAARAAGHLAVNFPRPGTQEIRAQPRSNPRGQHHYRGVVRNASSVEKPRWIARLYFPGNRVLTFGSFFPSAEVAARAHDAAARLEGILTLNFPRPGTDEVLAAHHMPTRRRHGVSNAQTRSHEELIAAARHAVAGLAPLPAAALAVAPGAASAPEEERALGAPAPKRARVAAAAAPRRSAAAAAGTVDPITMPPGPADEFADVESFSSLEAAMRAHDSAARAADKGTMGGGAIKEKPPPRRAPVGAASADSAGASALAHAAQSAPVAISSVGASGGVMLAPIVNGGSGDTASADVASFLRAIRPPLSNLDTIVAALPGTGATMAHLRGVVASASALPAMRMMRLLTSAASALGVASEVERVRVAGALLRLVKGPG